MNGKPKYVEIAADLRQQITTGQLAPGDRIPAGLALAAQHNAARDTVGKAIRQLEQEGLITGGLVKTVARHDRIPVAITRAGTGWAGEAPTGGADSWGAAVQAAGRVPSQRIDPPGPVIAEGELAERLEVAPGTVVIMRRLVRFADSEPHNLITFWFLRDVAEGTPIMEPESIAEGSIAWLEKRHGLLKHRGKAHPRMPSPEESEILRIPPGVPVEEVWRVGSIPERVVPHRAARVVVASRAICPGDRMELTW